VTTSEFLSGFYEQHRTQLEALAQAWLAGGATSFRLCDLAGGAIVWPEDAASPDTDLFWADVTCIGKVVARAGVCLQARDAAQRRAIQERLNIDADFIGQFGDLENELETLTADLVTTQDQLLALYNLSQFHRNQQSIQTLADSRAMLNTLVSEVARLTQSQCMCFVQPAEAASAWMAAYPQAFLDTSIVSDLVQRAQGRTQGLLLSAADMPQQLQHQFGNLVIIPMHVHGISLVGMLLATRMGIKIASPDLKLARTLSDQLSAQLENALLYHELLEQAKLGTEMELAQQMQMRLLPQQIPYVPGFDIAAATKPALQVGGDFYDLIYKPGKPFIFSVGDATGKGLSAALIMAMSHTSMRSAANFMPLPLPANVLRRVNDNLYGDLTDLGIFVTAFTGYCIPGQHELVYANAGHSPVIYKPVNAPARLLEADGPPIGVLPESLSENQTTPFHTGDLLVVATDGFSEAHNKDNELLGYERLLAHVERVASQSAQAIAASLFQLTDDFAAGHMQDDDQTLVIIKGQKE
jgi:sigma-B regulation protein RsbU (phosphoserine phosphatase)